MYHQSISVPKKKLSFYLAGQPDMLYMDGGLCNEGKDCFVLKELFHMAVIMTNKLFYTHSLDIYMLKTSQCARCTVLI